jgi:hypothetical protein
MQRSTTAELVQDVTSGGGWTPEQREMLERVRAFTPEERAAALEATRATLNFTRAVFERRQRKSEALLLRMADSTPEECVRLDDEFWRDLRAENRIMAVRRAKTGAVRLVAVIRPRSRGAGRPRAQAARSSAKSGDSGDDAGDSEPPAVEPWRWASEASWLAFVESVQARDCEAEIGRERWSR